MNNMFKRSIMYFLGLFLIAFGIATQNYADLGLVPYDSIIYEVADILEISVANSVFMGSMILMIIVLLLERKMKCLMTVITGVILSQMFSIVYAFYNIQVPSNFIIQFIVLLIGLIISALGVSLCINSLLPCTPIDQLILTISNKLNVTQGKAKIIIDALCLALAIALGSSIGIGTVVVVGLFGVCLNYFNNLFLKFKI